MINSVPKSNASESDKLAHELDTLLGETLGAFPKSPLSALPLLRFPPAIRGLCLGLIYAVLFVAIPLVVLKTPRMMLLTVWGACYFLYAVTAAELACASIRSTISEELLPFFSEQRSRLVSQLLRKRFSTKRILWSSTSIALACTMISIWTIRFSSIDLPGWGEMLWWACGFFVLYLTAARVTDISRFYGVFSASLSLEDGSTYEPSPAHSLLVKKTALVGRLIVLFWIAITISVWTLLPVVKEFHEANSPSLFVYLLVPIASFFSLGFGTFYFLRSESQIRRYVERKVDGSLHSLQHEINTLFLNRDGLPDPEIKRLQELRSIRKELEETGYYRSFGATSISLLTPLVTPIASIASHHTAIAAWLIRLKSLLHLG